MLYQHSAILGSFSPLHIGHISLITHTLSNTSKLTILLFTSETETLPSALRQSWLKQEFKGEITVIPVEYQRITGKPVETNVLYESLEKSVTDLSSLDSLFSGCSSYTALASKLSIPNHSIPPLPLIPTPSTLLLRPLTHWLFLAPSCRPHFVKKICLMGPQSVGKSTLATLLSTHFHTTYAQQTSRLYTNTKPNLELHDYIAIAQGKLEEQELKIQSANKVLLVDTDVISTRVYLDIQFPEEGWKLEEYFEEVIGRNKRTMEVYVLIEPRGEGVEDGSRRYNGMRRRHFEMIKERLEREEVRVVVVDGGWEENFERCVQVVQEVIDKY